MNGEERKSQSPNPNPIQQVLSSVASPNKQTCLLLRDVSKLNYSSLELSPEYRFMHSPSHHHRPIRIYICVCVCM